MQVVLVRMGRGVNIQCSPAIFTTEGHRGAQRKQPVELRQTCLSARGGKGHEGGGRWSGLAFCPPWWGSVLPGSGGEQPENVSGNQESRKGGGETAGLAPSRKACQAEGMDAKGATTFNFQVGNGNSHFQHRGAESTE